MSRVGFTFIWKIENVSFLPKLPKKEAILSPIFMADNLEQTSWILRLYPIGYFQEFKDNYIFELSKRPETGPNCITLDYELSIISNVGSNARECVKNVKVRKFLFHTAKADGTPLSITSNEIFSKRENLPRDTLTIQCMMWFHNNSLSIEPGFSLARTQIDVQRKFFTWTIDNFSTLIGNAEKSVSVLLFSKRQIDLTLKFSISVENVRASIEGKSSGKNSLLVLRIAIQNTNGGPAIGSRAEYMLQKEKENHPFPFYLNKEKLMAVKDLLLPEDKLSLKCDLEVYDVVLNLIELTGFGDSSTIDLEAALTNTNRSFCLGKRKRHPSPNSLKKDLRYLFEEKQHADVNLRVHDETFPVHKAVLAARSSVFKTMFDTDMKEKLTNTIEIDDIKPDTMRRLLLYIYSDTFDSGLQWENASSLYIAADKYDVLGLKEECSSYLMANTNVANACKTIVLADMLNDQDLNNFVLSFIHLKDKEVLNSDEWKNFAQMHPQFTIDILTRLYKNVKQLK